MRFARLFAFVMLCATTAHATQWEVNPSHPKASDENPGAPELPFKTISRAARAAEPGDIVLIHDGVYRESVVAEKSGSADKPITFKAAPGARVILTGADSITDWKKEPGADNVFSAPWPHRFIGWNKSCAHPDDDYHRLIGRAEQVFVLGYPLHQVLDLKQLGRGAFYVDLQAQRLYVCPSDNRDLTRGAWVEASARGRIWESKGAHIHLRGLRFRYAANAAQQGAALFSGEGGLVEDCTFEKMNAGGAVFTGKNITARRCVFQDNGELGLGAGRAERLTLEGCILRNNNTKGFSRDWEAGGCKLCLCRGVVIRQCQILENRGPGVWFDIGCEECDVGNNLIADNEGSGVFYEISYGLRAHDNVITGNGLADYPGSWGASCGIALSSSPGCVVERNLLIGNKEGFNFREQDRTTQRIDDPTERWIWNHDQVIRNNVLAYNRDAQVWGWFDCADGRHWPAAMQEKKPETGQPREDMARDYLAKSKEGAPVGLDLAKLKIQFSNNLYVAADGAKIFNWGVGWKKHKEYARLDDVRRELGLEQGGRQAALAFGDLFARDYRVPAGSLALQMRCYPRGGAPGVLLGRLPEQGR